MATNNRLYTVTLGCQAENHVGMQQLGQMGEAGSGFTVAELEQIGAKVRELGGEAELVDLCEKMEGEECEAAAVLVIRNVIELFGHTKTALLAEQDALTYDCKAFMYGRVVNKHARYNLCFGDEAQEPDIANKKGTVVAWRDVPKLTEVKSKLLEVVGSKGEGLQGEGNYYFDTSKCGIGFHGDAERRKVVALRIGSDQPIYYQWFRRSKAVGEMIKIDVRDGDAYIMSEKAVGTDWKMRSKLTLRHAVGAKKFVTLTAKQLAQ